MALAGPVPPRIDERGHPDLAILERITAITAGRLVARSLLDGRDPTVRATLPRSTVARLLALLPRGSLRVGSISNRRGRSRRPPSATGPIGHGSIRRGAALAGFRNLPDLIPNRHEDVPRLARRGGQGLGRRHGLVPRQSVLRSTVTPGIHRTGGILPPGGEERFVLGSSEPLGINIIVKGGTK